MAFSGSHFRFRGCQRRNHFRRYRGSRITLGRNPWAAAITPCPRLFTDAVTTAEDDIAAMIVPDLRVRTQHICPTRFACFIRPGRNQWCEFQDSFGYLTTRAVFRCLRCSAMSSTSLGTICRICRSGSSLARNQRRNSLRSYPSQSRQEMSANVH